MVPQKLDQPDLFHHPNASLIDVPTRQHKAQMDEQATQYWEQIDL